MSTSLRAVSIVCSSDIYFVVFVFLIFMAQIAFFLQVVFFISEKSIFGSFEVIFLSVQFFQAGGTFLLVHWEDEHFNAKMSFLASLSKEFFDFSQNYPFFAIFDKFPQRVIFSQRVLWEVFLTIGCKFARRILERRVCVGGEGEATPFDS